MERTKSIVHNEIRLFGIKIFSSDYTIDEMSEDNHPRRRGEQIMFLEKLYRQGYDNNSGDIPF